MHFSLKQIKKVKSMRFHAKKKAEINTMHAYNTQKNKILFRLIHARLFTDTRFRNKQTSEYTFTISTPVQL